MWQENCCCHFNVFSTSIKSKFVLFSGDSDSWEQPYQSLLSPCDFPRVTIKCCVGLWKKGKTSDSKLWIASNLELGYFIRSSLFPYIDPFHLLLGVPRHVAKVNGLTLCHWGILLAPSMSCYLPVVQTDELEVY